MDFGKYRSTLFESATGDLMNLLFSLSRLRRRIFNEKSKNCFDHSGYYTIVLTQRTTEPYNLLKQIFQELWFLHIVNVNVLSFENADAGTSVFTFFPYSEEFCDDVRPVLWDYFVDDHFTLNDGALFARKLDNFHGCSLSMATFHSPPYMLLNGIENGTTPARLEGIEGLLFDVLAQKLNFRPVITILPGVFPNASLYFDVVRTDHCRSRYDWVLIRLDNFSWRRIR